MVSSPPLPTCPDSPPESDRLAILQDYALLNTSSENVFDQLVELAAQVFDTPMAALSLADADRLWFKARKGIDLTEVPREMSFCATALHKPGPLIVSDAARDARFAAHYAVVGEPFLRFYVGVPIVTATGHPLGVLCVLDRQPREVSARQLESLQSLAVLAVELIEQRRLIRRQRLVEVERVRVRQERDRLASMAATSEARFLAVLDALPVAAYTCDAEGLITYFNDRAVEAWGRAPALHDPADRFTGCLHLVDADGNPMPPDQTWMARAIRERRPQLHREVIRVLPQESRRHFLANASPLFDAAGNLTGAVNVLIDITEAKQAELALRMAEARLETAARAGHVGIGEWDLSTNRLHWSHVHAELWDMTPEAFQGTVDEFLARVHPEDRQPLLSAIEHALATLSDIEREYRLVRDDGSLRWIHSRATVVTDKDGRPQRVVGIVADITANKQAELRLDQLLRESEASRLALAASEQRYRELFEKHPHPLWVFDVETLRFIDVNAAAVTQYGYSRAEFLQMSVKDIRPPEEVPALLEEIGRFDPAHVTAERHGDWRHRRKDGSIFNAAICSHAVLINGRPARLVLAIDLTEKQALQDQFLRAQRMENLGLLAAGIAHDLNNILTPMMMIAPLLGRRLTSETDQRLLVTVEQSVRRGAGLVKQITGFARGAGTELVPVQVKHLARDVATMVRETFPRSIRFVPDIAADLPAAHANPTQVHQVMLNLCVNARDAMPDGGELRLNVRSCQLDELAAQAIPEARAGSFVLIEVTDTGTGIPPEVLERMWEPFYTTKPEGKGTGLGLSTVRGIVARHEGFVAVETAVGRGTIFRVYLPVDHDVRDAANSAPPTETPPGTGECILFVDDEREIRVFAHAALTQHGFRVLIASDAAQALDLFRAHKDEVRLVITDHHMPGLKGDELIAGLRTIQPHLPVLICSGSSGRQWPGLSKDEMLLKPFEPATLLSAIRQLLR